MDIAKPNYIYPILLGLLFSAAAFAQDPQQPSTNSATTADTTTNTAGQQQAPKPVPPAVQENPQQEVTPSETAGSKSTIGSIFRNVKDDQKDIWLSPFHINHDNSKWWLGFTVGTAALVATDRTTDKWISYSATQTKYSKDISQIGEDYVAYPIAIGLYFYGRAADDPKAREVGVLGASAMLDSEIVVNVLKVASGRERPNVVGGNGRFFKGQGFNSGFPSGHAIETWTFASVLAHEYAESKVIPIMAYGLAATVSVARYTGQFHYPSDIVAGGAMGWFIGKYVWDHHQDPTIHKRYGVDKFMPSGIGPVIQPSTHTYGASLMWGK